MFGLYIVVSCRKRAIGALSCLVFHFQMSSFATDSVESDASASILQHSQVHSLVAFYEGACYAPNMSAYSSTAFKLIGPMFLVLFVVAWTCCNHPLSPPSSHSFALLCNHPLSPPSFYSFSLLCNHPLSPPSFYSFALLCILATRSIFCSFLNVFMGAHTSFAWPMSL